MSELAYLAPPVLDADSADLTRGLAASPGGSPSSSSRTALRSPERWTRSRSCATGRKAPSISEASDHAHRRVTPAADRARIRPDRGGGRSPAARGCRGGARRARRDLSLAAPGRRAATDRRDSPPSCSEAHRRIVRACAHCSRPVAAVRHALIRLEGTGPFFERSLVLAEELWPVSARLRRVAGRAVPCHDRRHARRDGCLARSRRMCEACVSSDPPERPRAHRRAPRRPEHRRARGAKRSPRRQGATWSERALAPGDAGGVALLIAHAVARGAYR